MWQILGYYWESGGVYHKKMNYTNIQFIAFALSGVFQNPEFNPLEFPYTPFLTMSHPGSWVCVIQAQQKYQLIDLILFR